MTAEAGQRDAQDGAAVDVGADAKVEADGAGDVPINLGSLPDGGIDTRVADVRDGAVSEAAVGIDTGKADVTKADAGKADLPPAVDSAEGALDGSGSLDADIQVRPPIRVLNLHMEEASWAGVAGEVKDSSGSGNDGTAVGTATTTPDGKVGRGGLFAGTGSVTIPDSPSLHASTALTVSAWIYPTGLVADDTATGQGIVSKRVGYGASSAFSLFLSASKLTVDIQTEDNRFTSATVFANNQWYHIAVVFDGSLPVEQRVSVYIDGVLDVTAAEDSASIEPYTSDLIIGLLPNGGNNFVGRIDEVGVWTRALSAAEITTLYTTNAAL